jgi:hypothetical protein
MVADIEGIKNNNKYQYSFLPNVNDWFFEI